MKTARLTWEDVAKQAGDQKTIVVHYDGIYKSGRWYEDHMMKQFDGCELLRLATDHYLVMAWPERKK